MRSAIIILLLALAIALPTACGDGEPVEKKTAGPAAGTAGKDTPATPPHAGVAVLEASCTSCHPKAKATSKRMSREDWVQMIEACLRESEPLPEEAAENLADYLAESFGP